MLPCLLVFTSLDTRGSNSEFMQQDDKTCDKRDKAITCVLCRDLHITLMFSGVLLKDLFNRGG